MNARHFCGILSSAILVSLATRTFSQDPSNLKLKDFAPVSIYKIPQSKIEKAKYPVIDLHSHDYPKSAEQLESWMKTMKRGGN